jgi:ubiquitin-activating enzyme E1
MRGGEASVHPGQSDESRASNNDRSATSGTDAIDEGLYSRQLYVLGHEAMRRMQRCSILLVGLGGLGVEIAKNLALAGVKSLTLHDPRPVELADLSSQFYCTEADIGKNRANVSRDRLADLNQYVRIDVLEGQVGPAEIANFSLVICTDAVFGECVLVNDACRDHGIAFIMAQVAPRPKNHTY